MEIILASTSPYRRSLLQRLQIGFHCIGPEVEENRLPGESPAAMARRLALLKASAVAARHPAAMVIGSDQVAATNGDILGKPGNFEKATMQLRNCAGQEVLFYTAVALVCLDRGLERFHVEPFTVRFRSLTDTQIKSYLLREQPYDCAGSFKIEGLGIALFEALSGNDPTSLEGLPLIALTGLFAAAGLNILQD